VRVPYWLSATFGRDLPLAGRAREGLDVNLIEPGLIRGIGQPAPVVGKPWRSFVKRCSKQRLRLAVPQPQDPEVKSRSNSVFTEGQELSIRGPGPGIIVVLAGCQPLQAATAVGQLPENIRRPFFV